MSVLSKTAIKKRMHKRDLYIGPILNDKQFGDVAIDLRLGNVALMARAKGLSHVDPQKYTAGKRNTGVESKSLTSFATIEGQKQKMERYDVPFNRELMIHPGMLVLVPTLEWVDLPSDLKGIVTARSSWAREGLNIATATFINPGYKGIITLELANFGQIPIALYPGMRVAQIAFYQVENPQADAAQSQFDLAFEPESGDITKHDNPFIPDNS